MAIIRIHDDTYDADDRDLLISVHGTGDVSLNLLGDASVIPLGTTTATQVVNIGLKTGDIITATADQWITIDTK